MTPFVPPAAVRPVDRRLARAAALLLLALFTATFTGLPDNPDAEVEFQTTSALVRNHSLAISGDTPEGRGILDYAGSRGFNVVAGGPGRESERFSWFGVGQALAGVPLYGVGRGLSRLFPGFEERHRATTHYGVGRSEYFEHLLAGWRNSLLTALTAWLLVLASRRLGASGRSAFLAGVTFGIATFAWPQARSTLSGVQATFFLFLGFHALLHVRERLARLERPRLELAVAGLALGWAVLTRVAVAPAAAVLLALALILLLRRGGGPAGGRRGLLALWLVVPVGLLAGLFGLVNALRFGGPLDTGYESSWLGGFSLAEVPRALAGLLVSPSKGIAWMAPGLLLLPLGLLRAWGRGESLWPRTLLALTLAVVLPVAMMPQGWHGGWTYGPRYLLPLLPFAWLGVPLALDLVAEHPLRRFLALTLVLFGVVVNFPAVLVDHTTQLDLAQQAARVAWPEAEGETEGERDQARLENVFWDLRFAAPWAHWRILRHRVAGLGEEFPLDLYFLGEEGSITPAHERERGLSHLAWIDFQERLGGPAWPAFLVCLAFLVGGLGQAIPGLDDPSL